MDDWKGLPGEVRFWVAAGFAVVLVAVVVVVLIGDWFRTWWFAA